MAAPTPAAVGAAVAAASGAVSPAWPAGHSAGQIGILVVVTQAETISLSSAQGFVQTPDSPQSLGSSGGSSAVSVATYWCRATSGAMPAPTTFAAAGVILAQIFTFDGCIASGDPWDVTVGGTLGNSTTATLSGDTTTVADCLVVGIVADSFDTNLQRYDSWANADLASVTEMADSHTNLGTGVGLGVVTGTKATAGAFGNTTATMGGTSQTAFVVLALKPPVVIPPGTLNVDDAVTCNVASSITFSGTGTFSVDSASTVNVAFNVTFSDPNAEAGPDGGVAVSLKIRRRRRFSGRFARFSRWRT